jgi:hypothetical protein
LDQRGVVSLSYQLKLLLGRPNATPAPDAAGGDVEQQLAHARCCPSPGAQRVKENYLARQRALDFEKDVGRFRAR